MIPPFLHNLILAAPDAAPKEGEGGGFNLFLMLPAFIIIMLLFQVMFDPRKRDRQRRETMLKELKKNDRVVTDGGVIGTVVNVSEDLATVTLRVEDNTRIKFVATSVNQVLADEKPGDDAASS